MLLKRFHSLSSSRAQRTGAQKNPPEHSLSSLVVCPPAANLSHLDEGSGFLTGFPQTHSFVSPFPILSAILSSIPPPHYPAHHPPIHHPSSHRAFIHPPFVNLSICHPSIDFPEEGRLLPQRRGLLGSGRGPGTVSLRSRGTHGEEGRVGPAGPRGRSRCAGDRWRGVETFGERRSEEAEKEGRAAGRQSHTPCCRPCWPGDCRSPPRHPWVSRSHAGTFRARGNDFPFCLCCQEAGK